MTRAPEVVHHIAEVRDRVARARAAGAAGDIALVPTMGALHAGHLAHIERARASAALVVVSIFVNPLQFGANEDLDRYPRTLDADVAALAEVGADIVFAPAVEEMYPDGESSTRVTGGPIAGFFEGASRPGHFDGMLTVVAKLLAIVAPDVVSFGQKDAQQVFLVRRMVRDLDIPVRVQVVDTVREPDGLALSSRNRYLGEAERTAAVALSAALAAAGRAAHDGVQAAIAAAHAVLDAERLVELDYFAVVDPGTFLPVTDDHRGAAQALIAARLGTTRLIDNATIQVAPGDTRT